MQIAKIRRKMSVGKNATVPQMERKPLQRNKKAEAGSWQRMNQSSQVPTRSGCRQQLTTQSTSLRKQEIWCSVHMTPRWSHLARRRTVRRCLMTSSRSSGWRVRRITTDLRLRFGGCIPTSAFQPKRIPMCWRRKNNLSRICAKPQRRHWPVCARVISMIPLR